MRLTTAIKTVDRIIEKHLRSELAFDANLFKLGVVKSDRTRKAAKEMSRVIEAWEAIKNEVLGDQDN